MSKFFIERPIFATVLAIVIVLLGLVSLVSLPIAQYPEITPPTVQVSAYYSGADAETISEVVGQTIEQQVNGVEDMLYMSSVSSSSGTYTLTVTFEVGTDIDMATVLVQNRVAIAESSLPEEVTRLGITTKKKSTDFVVMISLTSEGDCFDNLYLNNYANLNIVDELKRLPGVGDVTTFGADDYSMRVWLDPDLLQARGLTPLDISRALSEQNVQVAAGRIGENPAPSGQKFQYTLSTQGRFSDPKEFENTIIKSFDDGRILRLKDVARVELASKGYTLDATLNGRQTCVIQVFQLPGANALELAEAAKAKMEQLSKNFPPKLQYQIALDNTRFVTASIDEVYETLFIAFVLVILVILLFLQDWRSTLIPAITIPVSIVGTFLVMAAMGFSINMLTLFGLILAIGIVVDDAIVVVENTSRHLEEGMEPKEAAILAMKEVTGPIVATTLVLLSVFIPTAFMGGITGQLFQQFAITIAASTVFSAINALTLSPSMCAMILRKPKESKFFIYKYFNKGFGKFQNVYNAAVSGFVRKIGMTVVVFIILGILTIFGFVKMPSSFIPTEDQGYLMVVSQLPDGAAMERTVLYAKNLDSIFAKMPEIESYINIIGFSALENTTISNQMVSYIVLKDWDERPEKENKADFLAQKIMMEASAYDEASVITFLPPAISGLGTSDGFEFMLQDKGNVGFTELQNMTDELSLKGNQTEGLSHLFSTFRASVPQLYLDIDRDKVKNQKLSLSDVFKTLTAYFGTMYVNDFNKFGRIYQVKIMAESINRAKIDDIYKLNVRNADGNMVPFGSFVSINEKLGTETVTRYNLYPAAKINGNSAAGFSSGQAMTLMEQLSDQTLNNQFGYEWTSMSYQEKRASSSTAVIYALAFILIFLVLSAQYESWTSPVAVLLGVPLALAGAILGNLIMGLSMSIYSQIGMILLIALAAKNAILIVEFARENRAKGESIEKSAIDAANVRLRPILMTSFAFILGVFPLVIANGAGAASRVSLGTAVFFGMILCTLLGTLFVPAFYVIMQRLQERKSRKSAKKDN
ncbi:MAG: multidrug efflux RND transporter permease subunit [Bacteroidales bacterium]|nr:multidrug efflux RND transporter permease subunit [Bacteroidales bacterium]